MQMEEKRARQWQEQVLTLLSGRMALPPQVISPPPQVVSAPSQVVSAPLSNGARTRLKYRMQDLDKRLDLDSIAARISGEESGGSSSEEDDEEVRKVLEEKWDQLESNYNEILREN